MGYINRIQEQTIKRLMSYRVLQVGEYRIKVRFGECIDVYIDKDGSIQSCSLVSKD